MRQLIDDKSVRESWSILGYSFMQNPPVIRSITRVLNCVDEEETLQRACSFVECRSALGPTNTRFDWSAVCGVQYHPAALTRALVSLSSLFVCHKMVTMPARILISSGSAGHCSRRPDYNPKGRPEQPRSIPRSFACMHIVEKHT